MSGIVGGKEFIAAIIPVQKLLVDVLDIESQSLLLEAVLKCSAWKL